MDIEQRQRDESDLKMAAAKAVDTPKDVETGDGVVKGCGDFSFEEHPRIVPVKDSKRVLVVGGGVTGLVTAW